MFECQEVKYGAKISARGQTEEPLEPFLLGHFLSGRQKSPKILTKDTVRFQLDMGMPLSRTYRADFEGISRKEWETLARVGVPSPLRWMRGNNLPLLPPNLVVRSRDRESPWPLHN